MAAFQAMGTSPERRDRLTRLEIGLAMIGAETLKKRGSKEFKEILLHLGLSDCLQGETL
jgi:hypothetical protein